MQKILIISILGVLFVVLSLSFVLLLVKVTGKVSFVEEKYINNVCDDSDVGRDDSFTRGTVIYFYTECEALDDGDTCSFTIVADDMCINSEVLSEQTCQENSLVVKEIICESGCANGECLR